MRLYIDMNPSCSPALLSQSMNPLRQAFEAMRKAVLFQSHLLRTVLSVWRWIHSRVLDSIWYWSRSAVSRPPTQVEKTVHCLPYSVSKIKGERKCTRRWMGKPNRCVKAQLLHSVVSLKPNFWLLYFPMWSERAKVSLQVQNSVCGENDNS